LATLALQAASVRILYQMSVLGPPSVKRMSVGLGPALPASRASFALARLVGPVTGASSGMLAM
jgi:hypothetical protein